MNHRLALTLMSAALLMSAGCSPAPESVTPSAAPSAVTSGAPTGLAPPTPTTAAKVSLTDYKDPSGLVFRVPSGMQRAQHLIDLPSPLGYPKKTKSPSTVLIREGVPPMTLGFTTLPVSGIDRLMTVQGAQPFFTALVTSITLPGLTPETPTVETIHGVKVVRGGAAAQTKRDEKTWHVRFVVAFMRAPNGQGVLFNAAGAADSNASEIDAVLRSVRFDPKAGVNEKAGVSKKK